MKNIQACVFDYGGTLAYESTFCSHDGMKNVLQCVIDNPFSVTDQELTQLLLKVDEQTGRKRGYVERFEELEYPQYIGLKYVFDYYQLKFDRDFDEIEYEFWIGATQVYPMEDAYFMLKTLQKHGIKLGIISNISFSKTALSKRIQDLFPDIKFEFIISSATIGFRKPNPAIFELAHHCLGIEKTEILYIGDQFDKDVIGAVNYGMSAALFKELNDTNLSDVMYTHIHNWGELLETLKFEEKDK